MTIDQAIQKLRSLSNLRDAREACEMGIQALREKQLGIDGSEIARADREKGFQLALRAGFIEGRHDITDARWFEAIKAARQWLRIDPKLETGNQVSREQSGPLRSEAQK